MQQEVRVDIKRQKMALSVAEAANLMGISRPQMYLLCKRDDFPSFSVGGRVLISRRGLEAWIDKQAGAVI